MSQYGFGNDPFGEYPFGDVNYAKIVLWDELPGRLKEQDALAGYHYRTFVESLAPNYQWIRNYIDGFKTLVDPRWIRHDLLVYFAANFGITVDLAEPEAYQRARASLAARWNVIKGTIDSYTVLCRVHGFEVEVLPLWWDGVEYSTTPPQVSNEISTVTSVVGGGNTTFTIRLNCKPTQPGEFQIALSDGGPLIFVTDDGLGAWNAPATGGAIDYGWGYATLVYPSPTAVFEFSTYGSMVGGCPTSCEKCKTHRIRLDITPGAISGQDDLTVEDAYRRLYEKIGVLTDGALSGTGVLPVHVELEQVLATATVPLSIGHRFDIIEADVVPVDRGLRWLVP